tara:strand:+ start:264 stop:440 length:177 start_codon:yes stop_codon:yes gene_type:complete
MNIENAKWCAANERTGLTDTLTATLDGISLVIPKDTGNRHYQAILEWVAEGNTIEDAD